MSNENHTDPADPADPASPEARIAGELRDLLDAEQREHDRLEAELSAVRARRDRYRRTLAQLTDDKPTPAKPARPGTPAKQYAWHISEAKIAEVWELVRRRTDQFTAALIARDTPNLSPESAKRALGLLRERELVRVVGSGRGGSTILAVMPGAAERSSNGA